MMIDLILGRGHYACFSRWQRFCAVSSFALIMLSTFSAMM